MRGVIKFLPVKEEVAIGDFCFHYKYGIGILKGVNPHIKSFEWHSLVMYDEGYESKVHEISYTGEKLEEWTLTKAQKFVCKAKREVEVGEELTWPKSDGNWEVENHKGDEDDLREMLEDGWVKVIAPLSNNHKGIPSFHEKVEGEIVDGQFHIRCPHCNKLD